MLRTGRVLLRNLGTRILWPSAQCTRSSRRSAAPARGTDVFLQEGQRALPASSAGRAQGRLGERRAQTPAGLAAGAVCRAVGALHAARRLENAAAATAVQTRSQ